VKLVEDSFAFEIGSVGIYGHQRDGVIDVLGVHHHREEARELATAAAVIQSIVTTYDVVLVDWCWTIEVAGEVRGVESYLAALSP
jgi:hypothetical protein